MDKALVLMILDVVCGLGKCTFSIGKANGHNLSQGQFSQILLRSFADHRNGKMLGNALLLLQQLTWWRGIKPSQNSHNYTLIWSSDMLGKLGTTESFVLEGTIEPMAGSDPRGRGRQTLWASKCPYRDIVVLNISASSRALAPTQTQPPVGSARAVFETREPLVQSCITSQQVVCSELPCELQDVRSTKTAVMLLVSVIPADYHYIYGLLFTKAFTENGKHKKIMHRFQNFLAWKQT